MHLGILHTWQAPSTSQSSEWYLRNKRRAAGINERQGLQNSLVQFATPAVELHSKVKTRYLSKLAHESKLVLFVPSGIEALK